MNPEIASRLLDVLTESSMILAAGYLVYRFLLRDTQWFVTNRFVLLGLVLGAAVVPWLEFPLQGESAALLGQSMPATILPLISINPDTVSSPTVLPWVLMVLALYVLGVVFFGALFARNLHLVMARLRETRPVALQGHMVRLASGTESFSFGRTVVIAEADAAEPERLTTVIAHEKAHVRQGHTLDLLLAECLRIVLWFHPAAWWLRRDVAENCEFLADRDAKKCGNTTTYVRRLLESSLAQSTGRSPHALVHPFHQHQLKRRIAMLTSSSTPRARGLRYLLTAILGCALFITAACSELGAPSEVLHSRQAADSIYQNVEVVAKYPGGLDKMYQFMVDNLTYPEAAKESGIQGKTMVRFVVDATGAITEAEVMQGFDPACDAEAIRVVEAMPKWTPAQVNGKPVATQLILPVQFFIPGALLPAPFTGTIGDAC